MELDEMKNAWLALNEKLDAKEKLSERLIREMYRTEVKKSVNRLLGYECLGVAICLLVLPFIVWSYTQSSTLPNQNSIGLIYWGVFDLGLVFWQLAKVNLLMKVDLTNKLKENLVLINTYQQMITKEKLYVSLLVLVGVIPIFYIYAKINVLWLWVFLLSVTVLLVLVSLWSYKRFYARTIRSIQENLNELKDLEA